MPDDVDKVTGLSLTEMETAAEDLYEHRDQLGGDEVPAEYPPVVRSMTLSRMDRSIAHQDASGAVSPVGVFHFGELVEILPDDVEPSRANLTEVAGRHGFDPGELEGLIICMNHSDTPAVDCIICVPLDDE